MTRAEADRSFIVNDGVKGIIPIRISLPKPPRFTLIDGYKLEPEDQYFRREVMPEKLRSLEKEVRDRLRARDREQRDFRATGQLILDEIWRELEANLDYYEKEILWIKKQWWHRLNGYWFFNNGIPTYIDGWHWFYLNYWPVGNEKRGMKGLPDYRDRDRKQFLFFRYTFTTCETFKNIDSETGIALPNENGEYEMVELPFRICGGVIQPKNRRGGNTHQGLCIMYEVTSRTKSTDKMSGIQSYTKDNAFEHFEMKVMPAWENMPFFFRPQWEGDLRPSELSFTHRKFEPTLGGTKLTFANTGDATAFDGLKQLINLSDESGKSKDIDIIYRWNVNKNTISTGDGSSIFGWAYHPSTVADMQEKGGMQYKRLFEMSNFYQRNSKTGQTQSMLFGLIFPAYDGLEGFIDKHGNTIIDNPTEEQDEAGFDRGYGSKEHILSTREFLLKQGTPESLKSYREHRQLYPIDLTDFFLIDSGDTGINIQIIDKRLGEINSLPKNERPSEMYDLRRSDPNDKDSDVEMVPNPEGRFKFSLIPHSSQRNKRSKQQVFDRQLAEKGLNPYKMSWFPVNSTIIACGDPFQFKTNTQAEVRRDRSRFSNGAGAALMRRNMTIDPIDVPITECKSYRFICTYNNKIAILDDYCEDMIMMCQLLGAMMFPETNVTRLYEYFLQRGYGGYLAYAIDPLTGKIKDKPGFFTRDKQKLFQANKNYIDLRGHVENHDDYLMECKQIPGVEYLTDFDLFVACGGCIIGDQETVAPITQNEANKRVVLSRAILGLHR